MTAVNIKADHGAKGDGQKVTATVTATSGSKNVSVTTNIFAAGDVGKYIAIGVQGTVLIYDTIATFTDAQHIVLTNNSPATISGVAKTVEWGTDDSSAFTAFKNAHQGETGVVLNIPDGRYCFGGTGSGIGFTFGIKVLQIVGASASGAILSDMLGAGHGFFLGGCAQGQFNDDAHSARISTVSADAHSLSLVNASDNSKFSINSYAKMTGFDIQGYGTPSNQKVNETVFITEINGSAITIQSPLRRSYKSTWPLFNPGSGATVDLGGPGALYALESGWDCDHEYVDVNIDQYLQTNSVGRNIVFTRGSSTGFGIYPTRQDQWTATNYDASGMANAELDKISETVTINGGTWHGLSVQSASINLLEMDGVHVTDAFNGTPRTTVMSDCTIDAEISVGPIAYGNAEEFSASNCAFGGGFGFGGVSESDVTGVGAYSMSNGIISRVKSAGSGTPPQWATPGGWCIFSSRFTGEAVFQVLDVYEDGTSVYISTSLSGGFPSPIAPATTIKIGTHPCVDANLSGCTASDDALSLSNLEAGPLWSGWDLTYTGNIGTSKGIIKVLGVVSSVRITVGAGYSGGTFNLDNPFVLQKPDNSVLLWNPVIDLTRPGVRTITSAGASGALGADSGLALPGTGNIWFVPNQITPKMSGVIGSGTLRLEINVDQGVTTDDESSETTGSSENLALHSDHAPVKQYAKLKKVEELVRRVAPEALPTPDILPRDFFEDVPKKKRRFTIADGFSDA